MRASVKTEVVEPNLQLLRELSNSIRDNDGKFARIWGYNDMYDGLKSEFDALGVVAVGLINEKPCIAIGVRQSSFVQNQAYIWIVATPQIYEAKVAVMRKSLYYIEKLMKIYDSLIAYVDASDEKAMKYAKSLGFIDMGKSIKRGNKTFNTVIKEAK